MTHASWHAWLAVLALGQPILAGTLRTVALTGHAAPGTQAGLHFAGFRHPPSLNNAGRTAFTASLAGPGVTEANDVGVWSEGHGQLVLVARSGDVAPGTPSGAYFALKHHYHFSIPVLNNAGEMAFYGHLAGRGVTRENNTGLWASREGRLVLVARSGSGRFSTVSGRFLNNSFLPALNDAGQTAFAADRAVWSEGSGRLDRVAIQIPLLERTGASYSCSFTQCLS